MQVEAAHAAVAYLHRGEMTVVDQRERAQAFDVDRVSVEFRAHAAPPE
jgi:hypothetical protein